jgi:hypothetical protein
MFLFRMMIFIVFSMMMFIDFPIKNDDVHGFFYLKKKKTMIFMGFPLQNDGDH